MNWPELYAAALAATGAAAGYYNRNIGVPSPEGKVNVRIPLPAAQIMDVRLWREEDVLTAVRPYVDRAPGLRHVSEEPRYQIQTFIEGNLLDGFSPRGSAVPGHVIGDTVQVLRQLTAVPQEKVPALPEDWPASGDSPSFGLRLAALTREIHATHRTEYAAVFAAFGFPADPLAPVSDRWAGLTPRPFAVLHADLHRKNMIVSSGATWFLDWELALWGDPAYEVALHLHKMDYPEHQRETFLRRWLDGLPPESTRGWEPDVRLYRQHEQIKSAIVDTIRYSQQLTDPGTSPTTHDFLVTRLAKKVNAARLHWGLSPDLTPQRVRTGLLELPAYARGRKAVTGG
ncbi:aminoglycoside phosphotransferase family protein [Streptomyces niger]|uniref:aminoglycoside phosphotransferase family protein n=1 Tax=Streptomyces niger TaxID=66373 RepID=UPI00069C32D2|nr:aminoglycoside phosphotransferase family protein [Streptomyces niger]